MSTKGLRGVTTAAFRKKRHEVIQPIDTEYRLIPLTQGQVAVVDAADYEWLKSMAMVC